MKLRLRPRKKQKKLALVAMIIVAVAVAVSLYLFQEAVPRFTAGDRWTWSVTKQELDPITGAVIATRTYSQTLEYLGEGSKDGYRAYICQLPPVKDRRHESALGEIRERPLFRVHRSLSLISHVCVDL